MADEDWDRLSIWTREDETRRAASGGGQNAREGAGGGDAGRASNEGGDAGLLRPDPLLGGRRSGGYRHGFGSWGVGWGLQNSGGGPQGYGWGGGWQGGHGEILQGSGFGGGYGGSPQLETSTPGYAGRGPKGAQRSDARLTEDVNQRLTDHPWIDATEIVVTVRGGEATLEGTVPDRETKRLAEREVETCRGIRDVHNHLRISAPGR